MSGSQLTLHCGQDSESVDILTLAGKCSTISDNIKGILEGDRNYRLKADVPSASFRKFVAAIESPKDSLELDLDCAHDIYKLAEELGAAKIIEQCKSFIDSNSPPDERVKLMEWMKKMHEHIEYLDTDLEWIKGIVTEEMQKRARATPRATPGEYPPHERRHESERIQDIEKRMALMEDKMRQQDTINQQVTELRRDLEAVKRQQDEIAKKLDDNCSLFVQETRQLTDRFRKLRPVLEDLTNGKDSHTRRLDALETTQHGQEEELRRLSRAIEEATRTRNPEVTEELRKCQMAVDEITRALNSRISNEISTLEKKLVEDRQTRESFSSKISKIIAQCQVDTENNTKMIAKYQNDRQESLIKIQDVSDSVDDLKDDISGMLLQVTRRVLEEKLKPLTVVLDKLTNKNRTIAERVSELDERVEDLETNSHSTHGNDDVARHSPSLHELSLLSERINALEQISIDEGARDAKVEALADKVQRLRQAILALQGIVVNSAQK